MLSYCTILCAVYPNSGRKHKAGCSPFVCSLKAKEMDSSVHLKYRGESHTAVPWQTSRLSCCGAVFCFNWSSLVLKALSSLNVWVWVCWSLFLFCSPPPLQICGCCGFRYFHAPGQNKLCIPFFHIDGACEASHPEAVQQHPGRDPGAASSYGFCLF